MDNQESKFDGGLLQLIGWNILGFLVTTLTLGICFPWAMCMIYRWQTSHTIIEGRRLQFNGTAIGLFGNWIKWWFLTIITLTIYGWWVPIKLEKWKVKNTSFLPEGQESKNLSNTDLFSKEYNIFSVKTVVAIGIGAALMFVLMRFVAVPSGVPNTNLNLGIAILALFAAIFGPVAGFLIGFIGHTLTDLTWGGVWWTWVIGSALFGLAIGLLWKLYKIEEGGFGLKQCFIFNGIQIVANLVIWAVIAPTLDILVYQEPANKVYLQGVVVAALNIAVVLILGSLLAFGYSKTKTKSGSLKAE